MRFPSPFRASFFVVFPYKLFGLSNIAFTIDFVLNKINLTFVQLFKAWHIQVLPKGTIYAPSIS